MRQSIRLAILSDIHGNLSALNAVLENVDADNIKKIICPGDILGYGPQQMECLEKMRLRAQTIIQGNHEQAVINFEAWKDALVTSGAIKGIEYVLPQLTPNDKKFIHGLPTQKVLPQYDLALAHGSFSVDETWDYVRDYWTAQNVLKRMPLRIGLIGHTHIPMLTDNRPFSESKGNIKIVPFQKILLEKNLKYLVNVGSVGQPRDGDPRTSYGILEFIGGKTYFQLRRIAYNIKATADLIEKCGLPNRSASRLFQGR